MERHTFVFLFKKTFRNFPIFLKNENSTGVAKLAKQLHKTTTFSHCRAVLRLPLIPPKLDLTHRRTVQTSDTGVMCRYVSNSFIRQLLNLE